MSPTSQIIQKLWNYCNVLRDDGMSYGDYLSACDAQAGGISYGRSIALEPVLTYGADG